MECSKVCIQKPTNLAGYSPNVMLLYGKERGLGKYLSIVAIYERVRMITFGLSGRTTVYRYV